MMKGVEGNMQKNLDRRTPKDRRIQPTPALSRHSLFGRREIIRRKAGQPPGCYVDRYSSMLFFFLILIVGLNILDSLFTIMILELKGWEANPVVRSVIGTYGDKFWIWKFTIVSTCLILLCIHSRFKQVTRIIIAISSIYLLVVFYQIFLLMFL
jgi:hypothetical protein